MKFICSILTLFLVYSSISYANQDHFESQYVKPISIRILSSLKGVVQQETFICTPQTCCFSEKFYCYMANGQCICDIHRCNDWTDKKRYWIEITGTEAERYCGRSRLPHQLTSGICLCDPDKDPPCNECNPPSRGSYPTDGLSFPKDCRGG